MPNRTRERALIITGAGAAIDFGAPSTGDLTNRVRETILQSDALRSTASDQSYERIRTTLADYLDVGASGINFEHIFHCAQEILANTFEPTPGAADEFKPILYPFVSKMGGLEQQAALTALVRTIPDILFEELSQASDSPVIALKPLSDFIVYLRNTHVTRFYTTNYDDFILQADPTLFHGFDPTAGPGPKLFQPETFSASDNTDSIFHLHGSVHLGFPPPEPGTTELNALRWFHDRAEARQHASYNGGPERQMDGSSYYPSALVTGFDKLTRIQKPPLSHYYASLVRDAATTDLIMLIGFGLTDLHVLAALADARLRHPSPPLIIVDHFEHGFAPTMWNIDTKHIEMLHALKMRILDAYSGVAANRGPPGWTIAADGLCAVWDSGFLPFLNNLDQLPNVLNRL